MCTQCDADTPCACECTFEEKVNWGRSFIWRWILTGEYCKACGHWHVRK